MSAEMSAKPKVPDNCCFVLFGVTGDLSHRLVIPALYNLAEAGLLPKGFCVVGVTRRETPVETLHKDLMAALKQYATRPVSQSIADRLFGCITSVHADPARPGSFENLKAQLALSGWEASLQQATLPDRSVRYRVRLGPYANVDEMNRIRGDLAKRGFEVSAIKN